MNHFFASNPRVWLGLAVAGGLWFSPRMQAQSLTVNFATDRGPVLRPGQGYLYSWWHTRESPAHGNLELKPNSWRIGYWGTWDYEYQPMVDQGVEHIQVILTDAFRNRAHTTVGGFSHDYRWQSLSYTQVVAETVKLVNSNNWKKIAFDPINEPDAFGIDGIGDWYAEAWVPAFRIIRQLRPQAEIVGPGFFSANLSHLQTFLGKAKADNVVPDIISQHLLDNQNADVVEYYTTQIRSLLTQFGLAQRPISFNEYINPGHIGFVEDIVNALAQAERMGVHSMMHSSWDDSGELPPWNSTGDAACFDGILSIPAQRERAAYWVYKFYGDLAGRMVYTSGSAAGWEGMASLDTNTPVARVLLGGKNAGTSVSLILNNIPASFGGSVNIRVERVTSNGNDLTAAPTVHSDANVAVSGGTASLSISGFPARTALMATIRPAGLPARVAKPTFNPLRGSYWKPTHVSLNCATAGATIRYTLDGSVPTASSPVYSGSIHIPVTTTVRAIAIKSGMPDSEIATGTFTIRKFDNGLYGEYWGNATLSGAPALTRGDPKIDFDYGGNRLDASLPYDNFSARWTGRLRAPVSGTCQLHTINDDGARLWINGVQVINDWSAHPRATNTASVGFTAGQDYDLVLEYFDSAGDTVMRLMWTLPGGTMQVIPTARLFPPNSPAGTNLLVGAGTAWKYLAPLAAGAAPAATWKDPGFDDSGWSSGIARIGFGGDGEITGVPTGSGKPATIYFRRTFSVSDPGVLAAFLDLSVVRDDGVVVYLNGSELFRDNMPAGTVTYSTPALGSVGNSNESTPVRCQVPRSLLLSGDNLLALEIHNVSQGDGDLGFDCSLSNPTNNTPPRIGPIPDCTVIQGVPVPPIGFSVQDGELFSSQILVDAFSGNPTLIPNESFVFGGYGSSRTVSFTPAAGQIGTTTVTVRASDRFSTNASTFSVTVIAQPPNTAPTISDLASRTIQPNTMSDEVQFTVGDAQTEPGLLKVTASSANQALVANSNLFINGTGAWRTLSLKPTTGQGGATLITLTVSDGSLSASNTFTVTVTDPPPVGSGTGLTGSYYNSVDLAGPVILTRTEAVDYDWGNGAPGTGLNSDNFSVRWSGLVEAPLSGTYIFRTITDDGVRLRVNGTQVINDWNAHAPTPNDSTPISLTASNKYPVLMEFFDSGGGAVARLQWQVPGSAMFMAIPVDRLYPSGANTPPTISDIADRTIVRNTGNGPVAFIVSDGQTEAASLTLSGSSSNPALVPQANIVFGGSGSNRTVTVTPAAGQTGNSTITVTVSDGTFMASDSFVLTVTSGAAPLTYNFDAGGYQGWTVVSTDTQGRQYFTNVPPSVSSPNALPQAGAGFIGLAIPAFTLTAPIYTQDSPHNTLWLRSPEFTLNGAGNLTAWLSGGNGYGADATGKLVANVPAVSFDDPGNTSFPSFIGIALRNVNTGVYLLAGRKANNGNEWEQVTFSAAQLAALDQNAVYTLDLLDVRQGGWGWVNLDSVTIPGTLVSSEPPVLTIRRWTGNQVRISWPALWTGFVLQRSSTAAGSFVNAGLAVTNEGGDFVAYDTPGATAMFYRLIK